MWRISLGEIIRCFSGQTCKDWGYGAGFVFELVNGDLFLVSTDKPWRAYTVSSVPVGKVKMKDGELVHDPDFVAGNVEAWCFDNTVVATVAAAYDRFDSGEPRPDMGCTIPLVSGEDALRYTRKHGIPTDEAEAEDLFARCTPIDLDGRPLCE